MVRRVQESGVGGADSDLGGGVGPADEQLVRIETGRVVHAQGQALVVTVTGEIDLFTVDRLRAAVAAGFDELRDGEILVIDLTEVTFLASQGLQALVDVTQAAQRRREPLRIVVDHNRPVIRPIEVTGLDEVLALFDTVEDALDSPS
jgi:anti-sigma B factor antagonist